MADAMERLSFDEGTIFSAIEAAIHLNRYMLARPWCAGKKVLDVACGQGYGAHVMAERWGAAAVHGVDISPEAIESAERYFASDHVVYHCEAAENLAALFKPREFDLIVSIETFEHLQDPAVMLRGLKRVIRPAGTVIVSCPNDHWYYRTPEESNPFHVRKYTFEEFRAIAEAELGPPLYFLLGTPVAGYINLRNGSRMTARAAEGNKAMLGAHDRLDALIVPTEERIDWTNCNYFAGIWGPGDHEGATTATVYACSLEASQPGHRQSQVENLRDEVVSLRDQLYESRRNEKWAESLIEAREARAEELRQTIRERERAADELRQRVAEHESTQNALREQIAQLERELRHVGLRAAAFEAEGEFIREQAARLRQEREQLQRDNEYQAAVIEEWRGYIKHVEQALEEAHRRIESSLGARVKRLIPRPIKQVVKRALGRAPAGDRGAGR